ncbi:hypothetical protein [uncultured Corynebacterium sp.]|uniref:hypothetical protein n=1 Tax=uncultured Corynebacterium sp. TaxID=159447 RepID=UPI00345B6832
MALLNFGYFFVEFAAAIAIGSASLFADSADFLEDTAINMLVFIAVAWPAPRRCDPVAPAQRRFLARNRRLACRA